MAMVISGGLFLAGSLPSVLPFAFVTAPGFGLVLASLFTLVGLFAVGVMKASVAGTGRIMSGLENLVIAGIGGIIAWFVGDIVGSAF
jgi:VIT1/CCC1 family predicted Fe2+/Mn2+ transporter